MASNMIQAEGYSPLKLTMVSERLPAISGLAKQQGKMRPEASTHGHVTFPVCGNHGRNLDEDRLLQSYFSVSEAQTILATKDPTSEVRGRSIIITGPTFGVKFVGKPNVIRMSSLGYTIQQDLLAAEDEPNLISPPKLLYAIGNIVKCIRLARILRSFQESRVFEKSMPCG
ncbi:uncharacterized protein LY89DRAFT_669191 [Mollisia scopiformis]|uniref:Uncharacterized protein n=1 Tax=Mollisia scopiformis TaxID=149040 RepID=A0A194X9D2_MOLSC|nr:uncharacterized protein LY89DRAFT_669191 [Mollisia scopiformis]KUJ16729.1 hypothetical protein LY89DRAFT_669191 [Mollisia scopiformis]